MPKLSSENPSLTRMLALLPLAFLLLGAVLRGYMMNRALGGNDENAMLMYFGYSFPEYIATNYYDANNHIFHTLLVNLMSGWFGEENAIAIRFPTFIFGIACLWMIYLTALELFHSQKIANIALLIAAVNPIHIHYSQTARGYSLIMFFSIAVIYYCLKFLRSSKEWKEMFPLALCGFLSVYVLPTNVFFLFGLAVWLGTLLLIPTLREEYGVSKEDLRNKIIYFIGTAVFIAIASFLAYSPVLEEMLEYSDTHPLRTFDTETGSVSSLAPSILEKIFQGPLLGFLPFLVAGCFWGHRVHRSRLLLLLNIYFVPLIITLVIEIGGYPRNYLFNLPLLVLFLAAGFVKAEEWIGKRYGLNKKKNHVAGWITALYTVVSLSVVLFEHFPSIRVPDPTSYQNNVRKEANPNDLLLISDPRIYMYARTTTRNNLMHIIQSNSLTEVKAILPKSATIEEYEIFSLKGPFQIFKSLPYLQNQPSISLDEKRKMISITGNNSLSALADDYESESKWQMVSGAGEFFKLDDHVLFGKQSLELRASPDQRMTLRAPVGEDFSISKTSLIVLTWASKKFNRKTLAYHPILVGQANLDGAIQTFQMLTGKINDGINIQVKERPGKPETYHWFVDSAIGILPPGRYSFNILLNCDAGQRVLYDGLRLFFIELA